jgi:putative spermidine/putrescine transport system substrate-binding protein
MQAFPLLVAVFMLGFSTIGFAAETATCYNCPPEWADWASQLKAIRENLGIDIPHDNKNSGQTLSQLIAEKNNPVADIAYFGVTFGILARVGCRHPSSRLSGTRFRKDQRSRRLLVHDSLGDSGAFVNKDARREAGTEVLEGFASPSTRE